MICAPFESLINILSNGVTNSIFYFFDVTHFIRTGHICAVCSQDQLHYILVMQNLIARNLTCGDPLQGVLDCVH